MLNWQLYDRADETTPDGDTGVDYQGDMVPPPLDDPNQAVLDHIGVPAVWLAPGRSLYSPGGGFRCIFHPDGNLVVRVINGWALPRGWQQGRPMPQLPADDTNWPPLWASGTCPIQGALRAAMQADGNLVIYAGKEAAFATNTSDNPGAILRMQDDGNLVIYNASRVALWSTGTNAQNQL